MGGETRGSGTQDEVWGEEQETGERRNGQSSKGQEGKKQGGTTKESAGDGRIQARGTIRTRRGDEWKGGGEGKGIVDREKAKESRMREWKRRKKSEGMEGRGKGGEANTNEGGMKRGLEKWASGKSGRIRGGGTERSEKRGSS